MYTGHYTVNVQFGIPEGDVLISGNVSEITTPHMAPSPLIHSTGDIYAEGNGGLRHPVTHLLAFLGEVEYPISRLPPSCYTQAEGCLGRDKPPVIDTCCQRDSKSFTASKKYGLSGGYRRMVGIVIFGFLGLD